MAERGTMKKEMVQSKSVTSSIKRKRKSKYSHLTSIEKAMAIDRRRAQRRDLNKENGGVPTAPSGAMSSFEALFFHDIPPEVLVRLAKRYTGGHRKYGVEHVNLNWRTGLNDPKYIVDRFNHAMDHIVNFLEDQNDKDDNLGGAIWNLGFLIVAETRCPKVFREAFIQAKLFGEAAKKVQEKMKNVRS